jgi:hypothetical protein
VEPVADASKIPHHRRRGVRLATMCLLICGVSSSAEAQYYFYTDWAEAGEAARADYIAGAFDSYVTFGNHYFPGPSWHYAECLARSGMTPIQLADNVLAYAADKLALHPLPVPAIMLEYLAELCGPAP